MTTTLAHRLAFALCMLGTVGACQRNPIGTEQAPAVEEAGAVGLALQIAPGVELGGIDYVVSGPAGFSRTGTIDARIAATVTTVIGGLPAGAGYSLTLHASGSAGITCSGSATFAVAARATATVMVRLTCTEPPRNGSIVVVGTTNVCPVVDAVSASLAEVRVGGTIALSAQAHDLDAGPHAVSYQWTASAGTLSDAHVAAPVFACTVPGPVVVALAVTDGDCSDSVSLTLICSPALVQQVYATVETDPVSHAGDAADDPAIWVNPLDPALSTIIGTDKSAGGGLAVYDLGGHQLQFVAAGELNNVDLRAGFSLGGAPVTLVTAGNRTNNSIAIFRVDPATRQLVDVAARAITTLTTYGSCMYRSPINGKTYYFVDSKAGDIEQWELFDNGAGRVDAVKVRNLAKLGSQPEACVVDDELGQFYIGEEDVGIWKYGAEPDSATAPVLVDKTGVGGHLVADVEGLAIARTGAGIGYLIAANQGDSTYAVYTREGSNEYLKTFAVATSCSVDGVSGSDGIDVTTAALGPAFPSGVFVTQDDTNPGGNQNFKLVPWQDISLGAAPPAACEAVDAGEVDAGAPDMAAPADGGPVSDAGPVGFPAAFCQDFCGKCASCWDPAAGFTEGDCLYRLKKPSFTLDGCLAGCAAGSTPAFPPSNLVPDWRTLSCPAFDDSM